MCLVAVLLCRSDLPCYLVDAQESYHTLLKTSSCCQGVELLIHLDGYSGPQVDGWEALKQLAAASSLVITEEMPTSPYAQWSKVSTTLLRHLSFCQCNQQQTMYSQQDLYVQQQPSCSTCALADPAAAPMACYGHDITYTGAWLGQ